MVLYAVRLAWPVGEGKLRPQGEQAMKFHFERIGPIEAADLQLGDLTIIAGRNNTGKTYLVYTMYGFLRTWTTGWTRPLAGSIIRPLLDFLSSEVGRKLKIERRDLQRIRRRTMALAASRFSQASISQIFSSPQSAFADARLSVELADALPSGVFHLPLAGSNEFRATAEYGKEYVELELLWRTEDAAIRRALSSRLAMCAAFPEVPNPFVLSAERLGISLFYKELDFTKSRLVEVLQQIDDQKFQSRRAPLLVVDRIASRYAMPV